MQSHEKHLQKHVKKQQEMKLGRMLHTEKKTCVCQSPASLKAKKRFTTHIFKTQKTIKLNAHGEIKGNCEKLNISCGLSAKTRVGGNSYVEC